MRKYSIPNSITRINRLVAQLVLFLRLNVGKSVSAVGHCCSLSGRGTTPNPNTLHLSNDYEYCSHNVNIGRRDRITPIDNLDTGNTSYMSRLFFLSGKPTNNNSNQYHANQNDQHDVYDFHYINNVHIFRGLNPQRV